jgi:uncharacterized membrane protein YphA (DoxX/SURF4 family)
MVTSISFAARFILGCIFLTSSWGKFVSFRSLPGEILDYQLLSKRQAQIVALFLPFAELIVGVLSIVGFGFALVSLLAIVLLLIFTGAIAINLFRGSRFSCHCFGNSSTMIGPMAICRNTLLIALACWIVVHSPLTLSLNALVTLWQSDIQQLDHLETFAPVVGTIILSLGILFLLGEIDVLLPKQSELSV